MDALANRLHGRMDQFTIDAASRRTGAHLRKLGDVRAGTEGFAACTAQDHAAQIGFEREFAHPAPELPPRRLGQGIQAFRAIENDGSHRTVALHQNRIGHVGARHR
jgi:hypothetical protein